MMQSRGDVLVRTTNMNGPICEGHCVAGQACTTTSCCLSTVKGILPHSRVKWPLLIGVEWALLSVLFVFEIVMKSFSIQRRRMNRRFGQISKSPSTPTVGKCMLCREIDGRPADEDQVQGYLARKKTPPPRTLQ